MYKLAGQNTRLSESQNSTEFLELGSPAATRRMHEAAERYLAGVEKRLGARYNAPFYRSAVRGAFGRISSFGAGSNSDWAETNLSAHSGANGELFLALGDGTPDTELAEAVDFLTELQVFSPADHSVKISEIELSENFCEKVGQRCGEKFHDKSDSKFDIPSDENLADGQFSSVWFLSKDWGGENPLDALCRLNPDRLMPVEPVGASLARSSLPTLFCFLGGVLALGPFFALCGGFLPLGKGALALYLFFESLGRRFFLRLELLSFLKNFPCAGALRSLPAPEYLLIKESVLLRN